MLPMFLQHGGAEQPTAAVVHLSIMMWQYVSMAWCGDVFIHVDCGIFFYFFLLWWFMFAFVVVCCIHSWWCMYLCWLPRCIYYLCCGVVCVYSCLLLWLIYSSWVWLFVHVVIHLFICFAVYSCMSGGVIFHGRSDGKIIHIWCSGEWNYTVF